MPELDTTARLLLYLAGELSPRERGEIDARLAREAGMREQLEQLRLVQEQLDATLMHADETQRLPLSAEAAARKVGRAIQQWHADRAARPFEPRARRGAKFGWAYSVGTAAAIIVICGFVMWSRVDDAKKFAQSAVSNDVQGYTDNNPPDGNSTPNVAESADASNAVAEALGGIAPGPADEASTESLSSAEQQLAALSYLSQPSPSVEREE